MKSKLLIYASISILIYIFILVFIFDVNKKTENTQWTSNDINASSYIGPLLNDEIITQKFACSQNTLEGISVLFGTFARENTTNIFVRLINNNDLIIEWKVNASELNDNSYYEFNLEKQLKEVKNSIFELQIYSDAVNENNAIAVYENTNINNSSIETIKQDKANASLCYKVIYSKNDKNVLFYLSIACITVIYILINYILLFKRKMKLQNIYLILFLSLSICYQLVLPPNRIPDETAHFFRAYEISRGFMISDLNDEGFGGRKLPIGLTSFGTHTRISEAFNNIDAEIGNEETFLVFSNTSLYAPISYIPQACGIFIGKLFTNKVLIIEYMGRLFNLLTITFITYMSIKYIPYGKKMILLISLIPMNIHESISLSPDGMVVALSIAIISLTLYIKHNINILQKKHLILMYILAVVLSLYKIVYVPLCLIYFIIPKEKFGGTRNYTKHVISMVLSVILVSCMWLLVSSNYLVEYNPGVSSYDQVIFILKHPFYYILVMVRTFINNGETYLLTMLGTQLGWLDININHLVIILYLLLLLSTVIYDNYKVVLTINEKLIGLVLMVLTIVLIYTSLYVQWTPVGSQLIAGIQGRYFIPIILPFLIMLSHYINVEKVYNKIYEKLIYLIAFSINICVIVSVLYYCI